MICVSLNDHLYFIETNGSVFVQIVREGRFGITERTERRLPAFGPTAKAVRIEARRLGHTVHKPLRGTRRTGIEECEA